MHHKGVTVYYTVVTVDLCVLLNYSADPKYLYTCPDRLRLPLVFYVAHPSSVYVNKLLLGGVIDVSVVCCVHYVACMEYASTFVPLLQKRVNLDYEIMFETGVDEMSWDDTVSQ